MLHCGSLATHLMYMYWYDSPSNVKESDNAQHCAALESAKALATNWHHVYMWNARKLCLIWQQTHSSSSSKDSEIPAQITCRALQRCVLLLCTQIFCRVPQAVNMSYTLNLNSSTSPSRTTYSFPSDRKTPASLAPLYPLCLI